jgi:glycosyltransferase involved in cell wall biosynthesis
MVGNAIGIVCPPPCGVFSGGHVFNREMLACAARAGTPMVALSGQADALLARDWDMLIWDSLMLDRIERVGRERTAILLHYLPSLEPGIEHARCARLHDIEEHAAARADCIVATSQELAAAVRARWRGKRVLVCEPGVGDAFRRRAGRSANQVPVLLTVANLLPAKGHADLLPVLHRLRELAWHWHVVGHGGQGGCAAAKLREQAEGLGLDARITLHGTIPQGRVPVLMAEADLLLHPSLFESYGMVLAEARATGVPAVSFRVGAAQRLIEHGATGFVLAPSDWSAFEHCLRCLLEGPVLRQTFERNLAHAPARRWEQAYADLRVACDAMLATA